MPNKKPKAAVGKLSFDFDEEEEQEGNDNVEEQKQEDSVKPPGMKMGWKRRG